MIVDPGLARHIKRSCDGLCDGLRHEPVTPQTRAVVPFVTGVMGVMG
jgi:hypothetical protein